MKGFIFGGEAFSSFLPPLRRFSCLANKKELVGKRSFQGPPQEEEEKRRGGGRINLPCLPLSRQQAQIPLPQPSPHLVRDSTIVRKKFD